jgi:hypothetical protein
METVSNHLCPPFQRAASLSGIVLSKTPSQLSRGTDEALPEADDPFRAEDRLPDRHQLDRQHDDCDQQGNQEQEPVLLEIGQRDQVITRAVTTLLRGIRPNTTMVFSIMTTVPTNRLVASSGVGQRGWINFSMYLSAPARLAAPGQRGAAPARDGRRCGVGRPGQVGPRSFGTPGS